MPTHSLRQAIANMQKTDPEFVKHAYFPVLRNLLNFHAQVLSAMGQPDGAEAKRTEAAHLQIHTLYLGHPDGAKRPRDPRISPVVAMMRAVGEESLAQRGRLAGMHPAILGFFACGSE